MLLLGVDEEFQRKRAQKRGSLWFTWKKHGFEGCARRVRQTMLTRFSVTLQVKAVRDSIIDAIHSWKDVEDAPRPSSYSQYRLKHGVQTNPAESPGKIRSMSNQVRLIQLRLCPLEEFVLIVTHCRRCQG